MKSKSLTGALNLWSIGLTFLATIVALVAGISGIFFSSSYTPFFVLGGVIAVCIGILWIVKPVWALYAALFVALLPIGTVPENIHSLLNRAMAVVAIGTWLIDVLFNRRKVTLTSSSLFMLIFLAWGGLTLFWAENSSAATTRMQVYVLRFLLFLFLIPNEIKTQKHLNWLLNTVCLSGWVLIAFSIFTLLEKGYMPGSRFKLFDANENAIGVLALLTMSVILLRSTNPSKNSFMKTLMGSFFMLLTIGLVALSGSRGSYISLLITLTSFWFWKSSRKWGKLGFAILALGLIVSPFVFETTLERFLQMAGGSVLGGREILWQAAWQIISQHPLGGVGIGNASYSVVSYLDVLASAAGKESVSMHNPILVVWSETGFLGIGIYLAVLTSAILSFIKEYLKYRKHDNHFLMPYFAFVSSLFLGYMASWIKGGGMEADFMYFLLLALLLIPSGLNMDMTVDASRLETSVPDINRNKSSL